MKNVNLEDIELLELLEQEEREKISPALDVFRLPKRIKIVRGGRGAAAKSWSFASLLIQSANYERKHIACLREVQLTLEESVHKLLGQTIERLRYRDWKVTKESIDNTRTGSHIIFRGISDLRADQLKSLEGFDIFWLEEAQDISDGSLDVLLPTLRKEGSELWASMNPSLEVDPIIARFINRKDALIVTARPGPLDNPWWTKELQAEMEADFARDPELAEHIWNGAPMVQGARSIFSRVKIRQAMERELDVPENAPVELGVDVARFGDDLSVIYKRKGMKVIDCKKLSHRDTQEVARIVWDMADRNRSVKIKVDDTGIGGAVTDKLRDMGACVVPVMNGAAAYDKVRYTSCADEQWFNFPIDEAQIPDDHALMEELSARKYSYTTKDQRQIEPKEAFKKRFGHSPDCFIAGTMVLTDKGNRPIETICVGDRIVTPLGIEKVLKVWESDTDKLATVMFSNGSELTGKPTHKIFTNSGFIPIDKLHDNMVYSFSYRRVIIWLILKLFSTKARSISFKQAVNTINPEKKFQALDLFIGEYGLNRMGQYHRDSTYTILTEIGAITRLAILSLYHTVSTCLTTRGCYIKTRLTEKRLKQEGKRPFLKPLNGINRKLEGNGIQSTVKKHGTIGNQLSQPVLFVAKNFKQYLNVQNIVLYLAQINISETILRLKCYVNSVVKSIWQKRPTLKKQNVAVVHVERKCVGPTKTYNLTLEKHNVYYANNILVENCADALLLCYFRAEDISVPDFSADELGL